MSSIFPKRWHPDFSNTRIFKIIEDEVSPNTSLQRLLLQLHDYMHNSIVSQMHVFSLLYLVVLYFVRKICNKVF